MSELLPSRAAALFVEAQRTRHRVLFVIVGLNSKRHVPLLHDTLTRISPLNDIVWCHKNPETAAESVAKKQKLDSSDSNLLQWLKKAVPEHLLYRDSHRILGKTCDMLVLQNFECLTPNTLITVIETVRGGGAIVLLLDSCKTLNEVLDTRNELHAMSSSSAAITSRFNRRLFKTLLRAENNVLVMDSNLRPLTLTTRNKHEKTTGEAKGLVERSDDPVMALDTVKRSSNGASAPPVPESEEHKHTPLEHRGALEILTDLCKTKDQATALGEAGALLASDLPFAACITAARGRGKTALLGLISAFVLFSSPSSIAIAAPFLENVQPFFEHTAAGLARLGLRKQYDFRLHYTFLGKKRLVSKLEILKTRHFARFISTSSSENALSSHLTSFPLIFVDEAAAVPVSSLKAIFLSQASNQLQSQRLFLSSTVGGYEGTGRAFKTKFMDFASDCQKERWSSGADGSGNKSGRTTIKHISLDAPIRYGENDPLERWINAALLVNPPLHPLSNDLPLPSSTSLFYLNKDVLFSGSALSEAVLSELYGLLAAGHYRNSPNDVQILADCESHGVFVLLGRSTKRILAAAQIAFEGPIMSFALSGDQGHRSKREDDCGRSSVLDQERTRTESYGEGWCVAENSVRRSDGKGVKESPGDLDGGSKHSLFSGSKNSSTIRYSAAVNADASLSSIPICSDHYGSRKNLLEEHKKRGCRNDVRNTGQSREGNLVPWVLYENFSSKEFAGAVGARVVRIVVHPQLQSMGYGSELLRRLETVLCASSNGRRNNLEPVIDLQARDDASVECERVLKISVSDSSVLFCGLERIEVPAIAWIGASFGLNENLTRFWTRAGYIPACVRQEPSTATGDFPGLLLKGVGDEFSDIVADINARFRVRFLALLGYVFRDFSPALCLSLLEERESGGKMKVEMKESGNRSCVKNSVAPMDVAAQEASGECCGSAPLLSPLSSLDHRDDAVERLRLFSTEMSSARSVLDLFPKLIEAVFCRRGGRHGLSVLQQAVLIMIGAQHKTPGCVARLLELKEYQVDNLLRKTVENLLMDPDCGLQKTEMLSVHHSQ